MQDSEQYIRICIVRVVQIPWTNAASYKPNLESCSQYKPFGHKSQTLVHVGHSLDICLELSFMKMEVMENTAMLRYVFSINTSAKTVHAYIQNSNILLIHPSTICRLIILTLLRNYNNVNSTSSTSCNFVHHTDFNTLSIVTREWRFQTHTIMNR